MNIKFETLKSLNTDSLSNQRPQFHPEFINEHPELFQ